MSTVYVIGAGASYGESLKPIPDIPAGHPELHSRTPPVTNGFFNKDLLDALAYGEAERDYAVVVEHIRRTKLLAEPFGTGAWKVLDLEELFSSLEIEREFQNPESDEGAHLLLTRNKLVRYIRRIIGFCTQYTYGEYYRKLAQALDPNDTVITFNWDLLLDQEFLPANILAHPYSKFFMTVQPEEITINFQNPGTGLYLKLHGSLNWFRCGNHKCRANTTVAFQSDTQSCLSVNQGIGALSCGQCGSEMNPVIVPPLLRKPVGEDSFIRSAWGLARTRLTVASKVVVIGFSAAPTDFYSSWLLRSTVGTREGVEILVINPSNRGDGEFKRRMDAIFLKGYDASLYEFSQIGEVLANPGQAVIQRPLAQG